MSVVSYLGPFFLLLGVLVFFHELGHFAVAKWLGVQCERFSIGFGPPLLRYKFGETEYMLAWLPLGGYVKMLGENPDEQLSAEESRRSFYGQSPLRRTAIALAGPAMNLLLSVVIIATVMMTAGWPALTSRIGSVLPNSAADRAGLHGGDRIVGLNGAEISRWDDLVQRIRDAGATPLALSVERSASRFDVSITPEPMEPGGLPMLGIETGVPAPMLVFPDPNAPAAQAGLRSGDIVTALNGKPVGDQYQLVDDLKSAPAGPLELEVERRSGEGKQTVRASVPAPADGGWSLESLGGVPIDFAVTGVAPASPAKRAGVRGGEVVLAVNGEGVRSLTDLEERVRAGAGKPLHVDLLRDGSVVPVVLEAAEGADPDPRMSLGIRFGRPELRGGEQVREVVRNPLVAVQYGVLRTAQYFAVTVESLKRLLTREIGVNNLTGPIGIGEIAAESFSEDILLFLQWLCIISVNLAIINLLPIPVLDGGHILFAGAEAVRGGPLGRRAREIAQTIGLSFVLVLMGLAFWNDLSRTWPRILNFFQGLL